ncbi:MAG TPA: hypothetical protein VE244_05660 [Nitrososphaeraceae archaeon]|nr:hypothetical protein [Nitrososphaeraceae archaeon]
MIRATNPDELGAIEKNIVVVIIIIVVVVYIQCSLDKIRYDMVQPRQS